MSGQPLFVVPASCPEVARWLDGMGHVVVAKPGEAPQRVFEAIRRAAPASVCVVGAPWEIPMFSVPDPTGLDEQVFTDNFYGLEGLPADEAVRSGDVILPELPVGRVPSSELGRVQRVLENGAALSAHWAGGLAVSTAVWRSASEAVVRAIMKPDAAPLLCSPPGDESHVREALLGEPSRLYFNVHGTDQEPVWVGELDGRFPPVLRPEHIAVTRSAVVVSEACYGAALYEGERAISAQFLEAGAGVFVGSTIIAWGPPSAPPALADLIVTGFYQGLDQGMSAGEALLHAKREILAHARRAGEPLSPAVHNTLLSFVLYGSPDARVEGVRPTPLTRRAPGVPSDRATSLRPSALSQVRDRMAGRQDSAIGQVRDRLSGRLDADSWAAFSRGRLAFADLAREFTHGAELQKRIATALAALPTTVDVVRYGEAKQRRVSVLASEATAWGRRHVALTTREDGSVVEEWVSR